MLRANGLCRAGRCCGVSPVSVSWTVFQRAFPVHWQFRAFDYRRSDPQQGWSRAISRLCAGSHPKARVNPNTIELLRSLGCDTSQLRSKLWSEFTKPGAPEFDFVFTVCDNAAAESCPL